MKWQDVKDEVTTRYNHKTRFWNFYFRGHNVTRLWMDFFSGLTMAQEETAGQRFTAKYYNKFKVKKGKRK